MKKQKSDMTESLNEQKIRIMEKEEKAAQKADKVSLGIEHRNIMIGVTGVLSVLIVFGGIFMVKKLADDGKYANINDTSSVSSALNDGESFSPSLGDSIHGEIANNENTQHIGTVGEPASSTTAPSAIINNNGIISNDIDDDVDQKITADIFTIGVQDDIAPITAQSGITSQETEKTPEEYLPNENDESDTSQLPETTPHTSKKPLPSSTPEERDDVNDDNSDTAIDDDYPPYPDDDYDDFDDIYTFPSFSLDYDEEDIPTLDIDPSDLLN